MLDVFRVLDTFKVVRETKLIEIMSVWEPSAQSRSFYILVDVLLVDRFLDDFSRAEGNVSGGVEIGWALGQGAVYWAPSLHLG